MMASRSPLTALLAAAFVVLCSVVLCSVVLSPAHAGAVGSVSDQFVTAADVTAYAGPGQVTWTTDDAGTGAASITSDAFDGRSAAKLSLLDTGSQAQLFRSYGAGLRPTNVAALLSGASFSYTGIDINFQLVLYFTPVDATEYGPAGTVLPCAQAKDAGVAIPGECYTVIKYEPINPVETAWVTTTLGDKQQPRLPGGDVTQPGWWPTKQIGQYAPNAPSVTLDQLLAQMTNYQVAAVGVSAGRGAPAGGAWLLNLTFGGDSYSFGPAAMPSPPAMPPAADTAALEQLIATDGIDVAADTALFVPTGSQNTDLGAIDGTKPVNGQYQQWPDPTDAFADVYSYSDGRLLGTFPVVNGSVMLTGADLSGLGAGIHHLLFRGQTSGWVGVVQLTILPAEETLAATGANALPYLIAGVVLVLLGFSVLLVVRSRRRN